jgi:hypothetical protein
MRRERKGETEATVTRGCYRALRDEGIIIDDGGAHLVNELLTLWFVHIRRWLTRSS